MYYEIIRSKLEFPQDPCTLWVHSGIHASNGLKERIKGQDNELKIQIAQWCSVDAGDYPNICRSPGLHASANR